MPRVRQAAKVLIWLPTLALGLALAIGIFFDTRADVGAKVFFLLFGGAMAVLGAVGLAGVRPRARRSQRYVLSWLEQVVAASCSV